MLVCGHCVENNIKHHFKSEHKRTYSTVSSQQLKHDQCIDGIFLVLDLLNSWRHRVTSESRKKLGEQEGFIDGYLVNSLRCVLQCKSHYQNKSTSFPVLWLAWWLDWTWYNSRVRSPKIASVELQGGQWSLNICKSTSSLHTTSVFHGVAYKCVPYNPLSFLTSLNPWPT